MNAPTCYHCKKPVPSGQSFWEGRGQKVCLNCFRTRQRCVKCGFPEDQLSKHPALGQICHFCLEENPPTDEGHCHLCSRSIKEGERIYEDHQVKVCVNCFNHARSRCFLCRFPAVKTRLSGLGGICEFCAPGVIDHKSDLSSFLAPLGPFLKAHGHKVQIPPEVVRLDWRIILGMQREDPPRFEVQFLDEYVHWAYPVYHLQGKLYALPALPPQWFLPVAAGQLAALDLCQNYGLSHLGSSGAFYHFARAWVQYLTQSTAERLGYQEVARKLLRWPEANVGPDFEELRGWARTKGPKGAIQRAHQQLKRLAPKP